MDGLTHSPDSVPQPSKQQLLHMVRTPSNVFSFGESRFVEERFFMVYFYDDSSPNTLGSAV